MRRTQTSRCRATSAPEPATIDGCQVIARIDGQVVLACEVLWRVNHDARSEPRQDSARPVRSGPRQLMQRTLTGMIDQKLLYGEFRRNIPPENMPRIEENLLPHFDETRGAAADEAARREEPARAGTGTLAAGFVARRRAAIVQRARDRLGMDSLEDQGQRGSQPARRWSSTTATTAAKFEFPTKARWEELMVRKSGIPAQAQQAYAQAGADGKRSLAASWRRIRRPTTPLFADVAKAKSEGVNAAKGGVYDWTTKGRSRRRSSMRRSSRCRSGR